MEANDSLGSKSFKNYSYQIFLIEMFTVPNDAVVKGLNNARRTCWQKL